MNERIKKLLIQSEVFNKDGTVLKDVTGYELNKFAELIVRECGRVYIQNQQDGVMTLTQDLLHHLGVKE
jgi:hypothetical protein